MNAQQSLVANAFASITALFRMKLASKSEAASYLPLRLCALVFEHRVKP